MLGSTGKQQGHYFNAMSTDILVSVSLQCNYGGLDLNSQQSSKVRGWAHMPTALVLVTVGEVEIGGRVAGACWPANMPNKLQVQ